MLGINIENNFSIAQHVQHLVAASAQSLYTMRVLRTRGLDDDALQHIFRATVVARLTYAASTWRGLTKARDRKRIDSVLDVHGAMDTTPQTSRRSTSCVMLLTMNYLAKLCDCLTTSSTH